MDSLLWIHQRGEGKISVVGTVLLRQGRVNAVLYSSEGYPRGTGRAIHDLLTRGGKPRVFCGSVDVITTPPSRAVIRGGRGILDPERELAGDIGNCARGIAGIAVCGRIPGREIWKTCITLGSHGHGRGGAVALNTQIITITGTGNINRGGCRNNIRHSGRQIAKKNCSRGQR